MWRTKWLVLAGIVFAVSGANCTEWLQNRDRVAALRGFSSADDLRSYLADQASVSRQSSTGGVFSGLLFNTLPIAEPMAVADGAAAAEDDTSGGSDPFSTTNIQEEGVDESDIVKNDGQTLYVLEGSTIHIVQATPSTDLVELASLEIASEGDSLYLKGDKLVALSRQWTWNYWYEPALMDTVTTASETSADPGVAQGDDDSISDIGSIIGAEWNDGAEVTVTVVDVSDPANPVVDATLTFEGDLSTSRLIDSRLYVVLTTTPRIAPLYGASVETDDMTLDEWLPDYRLEGKDGTTRSGDVVGWEDVYRPEEPDGYGLTTVVTIDVDDPTATFESTAITADAYVVYASTKALYVTDSGYDWTRALSYNDTVIHKLAFTETGTDYVASGIVPGRPLNQYSLGEYNDYLRIATTVDSFGIAGSVVSNAVYVLGESGLELEVQGSVTDIAPGEEIYAARFIGDRGFLVTFERIDPLFTLDLSDPSSPEITGELKVPGYSDHIQLMDENHLLTIGKDTQDAGSFAWVEGVQLSVFDVSDMSNPQLKHKEVIGTRGTHSEANYNPKAFNYFPARDALAFPIDVYAGDPDGPVYGSHVFTGLYVYEVTAEDGFTFLGGIPSVDGVSSHGCYWSYWGFTRGVFIGDTVYSATQAGVKAASLSDVGTIIGQVDFESEPVGWEDCWFAVEPDIILPEGEGLQ